MDHVYLDISAWDELCRRAHVIMAEMEEKAKKYITTVKWESDGKHLTQAQKQSAADHFLRVLKDIFKGL